MQLSPITSANGMLTNYKEMPAQCRTPNGDNPFRCATYPNTNGAVFEDGGRPPYQSSQYKPSVGRDQGQRGGGTRRGLN